MLEISSNVMDWNTVRNENVGQLTWDLPRVFCQEFCALIDTSSCTKYLKFKEKKYSSYEISSILQLF